jgi:hypothetical protein
MLASKVTALNAEHMGANLLPWNAAVRLQARASTIGEKVWIVMAKIIEFYIPNSFRKKVAWVPPEQRGKVIEFCLEVKQSA